MHKRTAQSVMPEFEEIGKVVDLIDIAGKLPASTVVVAGGHRVEDLRLVESARDHGIVDRIILVGSKDRIAKSVTEVGIEIDPEDIVPADKDEQIAKATVELIRNGKADIVLKGGISTPVINRHMLPLAIRSTVSLATVFDAACIAGGRPMVLTDPGVTTVCNFGRVRDLARNAVDVAQTVMGIEKPRVAILSANEKQIPSLPSTWIGLEMARRSWPDAVVCGPLSFDLATDPESVSVKGLPDLPNAAEVAGRADVLVCPGIDTANALYKTISAMNKYGEASLASITVGFPVPYIILSRSDSVETRLVSIALSAVYTQRGKKQRRLQKAKLATTRQYRILAVDPDRTPILAALYENDRSLHQAEVFHDGPSSGQNGDVAQLALLVCGLLDQWGEEKVDAIAVASGLASEPAEGPSAEISDAGDSGRSLGPPLAEALALKLSARALVVSPSVTTRYAPEAKLSGYEPIVRGGSLNALMVSAVAERAAADIGLPLSQVNLVIAYLDDVITTAAVRGGTIIDGTVSPLGEGPFTLHAAGSLPARNLIELCFSGRFSRDQLIGELTRRGGLRSYLGTDLMEEVERRIADGDDHARAAAEAMVYQIAKEIGRTYVATGCDVEMIVLAGSLIRSSWIQAALRRRVIRLAPVTVYKDLTDMAAVAHGAVEILSGRRDPFRDKSPGQ